MAETMKAVVMHGPRDQRMEERPMPKPAAGELLVKVEHVGICGSDMHFLEEGRLGNWVVEKPLVLGHESAGEVVELGPGVEGFAVGDKVTLEPGVPCGECFPCRAGHYNLCSKMSFMAIPDERDGVFLEYVAHPAKMAYKLPENVGTLEGALCEPLCVGLYAAQKSGAWLGQSALIFGSGCIGLVTMLALKSAGVHDVTVVDVIGKRLEKAKELGATAVIRGDQVDAVQAALAATEGRGFPLVFECAGHPAASLQATKTVAANGVVVLVGMAADPELKLDVATLSAKEARVETIFRYRNLYPTAVSAVAGGLPLAKIASHIFPFKDLVAGMLYNMDHKDEVIKGVVSFV
ncbi:MAG: NAD(P)-dependent alcohol dehydrogenase [Deltaproteobacteria bacterium]|jgi:L-iditol 2-dehydrogenase|nr:NAD(P)-dependent alcohol dehydrogenase [Deltaproteobacteria bacterium]